MPSDTRHPGLSWWVAVTLKYVNRCSAGLVGIVSCQQFGNPVHRKEISGRGGIIRRAIFGGFLNTQAPVEHLSKLRAITRFPVDYVRSGRPPALTAAATYKDHHARVDRDPVASVRSQNEGS